MTALLTVTELTKEYPTPRGPLPVLSGVTLSAARGDAISIMGPSGSGKSTLLYILGALEKPTAGSVTLDGRNPFELPARELAGFRNRTVGFVFQDHCLLPQLTVLENVLAPTLVAPPGMDYLARARRLLGEVGLAERIDHRPAELSGGERQRVALARAMIMNPTLLLCDEPPGNLDRSSAEAVSSLLFRLHSNQKTILVVVTHNAQLGARFSTRLTLTDGRLEQS